MNIMANVYWCMGIVATVGIAGYWMPVRDDGKGRRQTEGERNAWLKLCTALGALVAMGFALWISHGS